MQNYEDVSQMPDKRDDSLHESKNSSGDNNDLVQFYSIEEFLDFKTYDIMHNVYKSWKDNPDFTDSEFLDYILISDIQNWNTDQLPPLIHLGEQSVVHQINSHFPGALLQLNGSRENKILQDAVLKSYRLGAQDESSFMIYFGPFHLPNGNKIHAEYRRLSLPCRYRQKKCVICVTSYAGSDFAVA